MRAHLFLGAVSLLPPLAAQPPQQPAPLPSVAERIAGMEELDGFYDLFWEDRTGKLWLRLDRFDEELLYTTALGSGLGSNPIGLDRAALGPQYLASFQRAGGKVLLVAHNTAFRARSNDAAERAAVAESFAPAVLGGFPIAAASDGAVLIDVSEFFLRDATDVTGRLRQRGQGDYELDASRSALRRAQVRAFPRNLEIEATLTFTAATAGPQVAATAATGRAFTLRVRHSLIRLPDDGYRPRPFDPRVGFGTVAFRDYAAPLGSPQRQQWIRRHRLRKADARPIVYYLDPGMPPAIRDAVREGASWWSAAFAAAGFDGGFRVEDLPADADPLDVRYNVIHWVHRATRGWSYGSSVVDPRTGEILKGNVLLGSLRVRQDHMLFEGLHGSHDACAAAASPDAAYLTADDGVATALALARLRQLAAHEVGHTLGLTHNFAASSYGRASVMDYPAPLVRPAADGGLDFDDAYAVGVGRYDVFAIRYGYTEFAAGADESAELGTLVAQGLREGLVFLTDQDARAADTCQPLASLWDNGADPVASLREQIRVRRIGLDAFGLRNLRGGAPLAELEDVFVPLYLHHRYQLEAALKVIGGVDYRHAVKGDGQPPPRPAAGQRAALDAVLETLAIDFLMRGTELIRGLPPAPPGHPSDAERFVRATGGPPDPVAMAVAAADLTVSGLLERHRAARLLDQADTLQDLSFGTVVDRLLAATWNDAEPRDAHARAVQRAVRGLVADRLIGLADDVQARPTARAIARAAIGDLGRRAKSFANDSTASEPARQFAAFVASRIDAWFDGRAAQPASSSRAAAPEGSPIGR